MSLECLANLDQIRMSCFRHWQKNALGKLEAREKLKAGTVVLKLKVAKNLRPKDSKENIPTSVEVPSDATGAQLAEAVAKLVKVEAASLKLISGGKVLKEEGSVCGDLGWDFAQLIACSFCKCCDIPQVSKYPWIFIKN